MAPKPRENPRSEKQKGLPEKKEGLESTRGGNRTRTPKELDFESSASTSSATRACLPLRNGKPNIKDCEIK